MRQPRLYGSVRGALGNRRPYRDGIRLNLFRALTPLHVNKPAASKYRDSNFDPK
jgi:hypothetical protein